MFVQNSNAFAYDPYEREAKLQSPSSDDDEKIDYLLDKPITRQLSLTTAPSNEPQNPIEVENIASELSFSCDGVYVLRNIGAAK